MKPPKESTTKNDQQVYPPKSTPVITPIATPPPFPSRLENTKKKEEEKEILELFRKIEINIPLLNALKQIPKYDKFLKELCTNKRKVKGRERVKLSENVSAII